MTPRDITAEVTALRQQSTNGPAFQAALEAQGYQLVTGKRGLLILDSAGHEHSLARRCGVPMKQVLAFMCEMDLKALPSVEQARAQYREWKPGAEGARVTIRQDIEWEEASAVAALAKQEKAPPLAVPEERARETRRRAQEHSRFELSPVLPPPETPERNGQEQEPHRRPASSSGRRPPAIPRQQPADAGRRPGSGATRKQQFRALAKAVTSPKPTPAQRRRRREETRGGLRRFAVKLVGRVARQRPPPQEAPPIWDAVSEQHFWGEYFLRDNAPGPGDFDQDCARPDALQEFSGFSPRL